MGADPRRSQNKRDGNPIAAREDTGRGGLGRLQRGVVLHQGPPLRRGRGGVHQSVRGRGPQDAHKAGAHQAPEDRWSRGSPTGQPQAPRGRAEGRSRPRASVQGRDALRPRDTRALRLPQAGPPLSRCVPLPEAPLQAPPLLLRALPGQQARLLLRDGRQEGRDAPLGLRPGGPQEAPGREGEESRPPGHVLPQQAPRRPGAQGPAAGGPRAPLAPSDTLRPPAQGRGLRARDE